MIMKNNKFHVLLLVLTSFVWGMGFVAQSLGAEHVGAFTFLSIRSWIAFFMMLALLAYLRFFVRKKNIEDAVKKHSETNHGSLKFQLLGGIVCGFFLFMGSALQQIAIAYTTAAKASFITAMYVVFVPVFSLFIGKKQNIRIWISVALGVAGLYLLSIKDGLYLEPGDLIVLLCAVFFSFQIMAVDHFSPKMNAIVLSAFQFFYTALFATVAMLLSETPSMENITAASGAILYAGFLSSGVGFTLQIVGQVGVNPAAASLVMSFESVFGALGGFLLLGQVLTAREIAGCAVMFAAIVLSQIELPKKQKDGTDNG